jgi:hypothetical protein
LSYPLVIEEGTSDIPANEQQVRNTRSLLNSLQKTSKASKVTFKFPLTLHNKQHSPTQLRTNNCRCLDLDLYVQKNQSYSSLCKHTRVHTVFYVKQCLKIQVSMTADTAMCKPCADPLQMMLTTSKQANYPGKLTCTLPAINIKEFLANREAYANTQVYLAQTGVIPTRLVPRYNSPRQYPPQAMLPKIPSAQHFALTGIPSNVHSASDPAKITFHGIIKEKVCADGTVVNSGPSPRDSS